MRLCADCGCPDAPHLNGDRSLCRCGQELSDPSQHHIECPQLEHSVVPYTLGVLKSELIATPAHPEGELPLKWKGWRLLRDGADLFRQRMVCRSCIEKREEGEKRHARILKRRVALTKQYDKNYASVYLSQGG